MSRTSNKLTVTKAKSLKNPGRYSDGNGLYLCISKSGHKTWGFIWTRGQQRRQMGLGRFEDVTLSEAREQANEARAKVVKGIDPIEDRKRVIEPTFKQAIDIYLKNANPTVEKTRSRWRNCLFNYAAPLHALKVSDIETRHVYNALKPIWYEKTETASRTRAYVEKVLAYCKGMGWRTDPNPAQWRNNLDAMLAPIAEVHKTKHRPSLPYQELPEFFKLLNTQTAVAARLLEFLILTACRSGEARFATWSEIDLENGVWRIPAERMKMKRDHVVFLSEAALEILRDLNKARLTDYVFTNPRNLRAFSVNAPRALLKRLGRDDVTPHGFRATFKTWATETTTFDRTAIELCLAHRIGGALEDAYQRGELEQKRRSITNHWSNFIHDHSEKNVIKFER